MFQRPLVHCELLFEKISQPLPGDGVKVWRQNIKQVIHLAGVPLFPFHSFLHEKAMASNTVHTTPVHLTAAILYTTVGTYACRI
jgi:hypothetical protein